MLAPPIGWIQNESKKRWPQKIMAYGVYKGVICGWMNTNLWILQGEFCVKLEIEQVSQKDKGIYKLIAKNDKGEASSQTVELTEIPEEKEEKIQISQGLTSIVSNVLFSSCSSCHLVRDSVSQ